MWNHLVHVKNFTLGSLVWLISQNGNIGLIAFFLILCSSVRYGNDSSASVSADKKLQLLVIIGIGQYEKKVIGLPLELDV